MKSDLQSLFRYFLIVVRMGPPEIVILGGQGVFLLAGKEKCPGTDESGALSPRSVPSIAWALSFSRPLKKTVLARYQDNALWRAGK